MLSFNTQNARFVSAHSRALFAAGLLLTGALLYLFALCFHAFRLFDVGPFSASAAPAVAFGRWWRIGSLLIGLVGLAKLAVYFATIIVFLMWLHRAYENLSAFAPKTDFSPDWAVGYWFIPFINLVLPYRVVKETWIKSDPAVDFSAGFAGAGEGARSTAPVVVWWLFWLVANVAGQIYFRLSNGRRGADESADIAGVASNALLFAAATLAAAVVWTIDQMQAQKGARLAPDIWSPPPPPPADFGDVRGGARG